MSKPSIDNRIQLIQEDITKLQIDAIVNAANQSLLGGGGVDGAIHRAGGSQILDECQAIRNRQGGCQTGEAVITHGGNLLAKYVIHTVGPVWNGGSKNEAGLLSKCYLNCLTIAEKYSIQSIAFPNISTGIYRFPKEKAARIAIDSVNNFLGHNQTIRSVFFVCFDHNNLQIYEKLLT